MATTLIEKYVNNGVRMYLDKVLRAGMTYQARVSIDGFGVVSKSGFRHAKNARKWAEKQAAEHHVHLTGGTRCANCGRLDGWHYSNCVSLQPASR